MMRDEIKKYLIHDIEFSHNGRWACFLPSLLVVGYDNEGQEFRTLDEAMDALVFDGQSLVDIWDIVYPQIS